MTRIAQPSKRLSALWLGLLIVASGLLIACSDDGADDALSNEENQQQRDVGFDDVEDGGPATDADGTGGEDADRPSTDSGGEWNWDDDFRIDSVIPARGPLSGGTLVHVHGSDLSADTDLLFGDRAAEVQLSQGQLVAVTPPSETYGPVTVRAISPDGEISEIPHGFTYADPVRVDSIVPDVLPTTGGMEITLTGSGFIEPMGVSFSGEAARRIEVVHDKLARIVVPPMPRGHADLRVTIPDGQELIEDALYFFDPLRIDEVEPGVGDIGGGDVVVIRGQGITVDTSVQFGAQTAQISSVDVANQSITVTSPAASQVGPVDVYLENPYDARRLNDGFYYDDGAERAVFGVQPGTAPIAGGSEHIVSGRDLDSPEATILIGDEVADIVESGPGFARIVAPPAAAPGPVDVVIEYSGVEEDRLVDGLEYLPELSLDDVTPAVGDVAGGDSVDLIGTGLSDVEYVAFGGLAASFEIIDDGHITATTPPAEAGTVDVVVRAGNRLAVLDDAFEFRGPVEVWSMSPSRGAVAGNTHVTLQGRGFRGLIEIDVGDQSGTDIRRLDPYTVTFRTPQVTATGPRDVELSATGQQAQPPYPFVYYNPMSSFGGAWGPSIDGALNVTVVAMDGSPVAGAFVMVSIDPDTPFRGYTNEVGQITLSGPGLSGPQTVTATAAEMSTVTVREIDARNLTLVLNPIVPPEGGSGPFTPPPMAHVEGTITITGKGTDPHGGAEYNMSMVRVTRNSLLGPQINPGADSIVPGEGDFEVRSRVGDVALVGVCGYYDAETDTFTPKLMAVQRYIALADGQRKHVELECNIPLEESLAIRLVDPVYAPDGPTNNRIWPYLDFGYEGYFRMPDPTLGVDDILVADRLPAPEGPLHDVTYSVVAGSYMGEGIPYSQLAIENLETADLLHSTPPLVGVPELIEPPSGGTIDEAIRLGLKGANRPDLLYLVLRNAYGLPVWTFVSPGDEDYLPMPEFPSFSDLPFDARPDPYQPGTLYTVGYGIRIDGFDYNSFTYGDFNSGRWSAFSVDTWTLHLVDTP